MGIRFWCPNGHKLNVKSFQAGRRGICPYCGAKFQIPMQSTRKPGDKDLVSEPQEHSVHEGLGGTPPGSAPVAQPPGSSGSAGAGVNGPAPVQAAGTASPAPSAAGGTLQPGGAAPLQSAAGPSPVGETWSAPDGAPSSFQAGPAAPTGPLASTPPLSPAGPATGSDPLAEAPDVVWYVRPPTGGQFGPATSDVMRNWIDEGRVSQDSLVWREGWRDWQEASELFPQLGAGESALGATGIVTETTTAPASSRPVAPHRRRSKTTSVAIIVVLVLAVIILFAVFLYVAFGSNPDKAQGPQTTGVFSRAPAEHRDVVLLSAPASHAPSPRPFS